KQSQQSTESLLRTRGSALERYRYYLRLLGQTPDPETAPDSFELNRGELTEPLFELAFVKLVAAYDKTVTPQSYSQLRLANSPQPTNQTGASSEGSLFLNAS